jgi:hypothetical protein
VLNHFPTGEAGSTQIGAKQEEKLLCKRKVKSGKLHFWKRRVHGGNFLSPDSKSAEVNYFCNKLLYSNTLKQGLLAWENDVVFI